MKIWLCVCALLLASCAKRGTKPADLLTDVRSYSDGIRWRAPEMAASRLKPAERGDFLTERMDLEEELRVDDYEITLLQFADKRRTDARVQVRYTWHMDREGIVFKTVMAQRWRRYGKRWLLEEQRLISGEPMPGTAEARELEDGEGEGEGEDEAIDTEGEGEEPAVDGATEEALEDGEPPRPRGRRAKSGHRAAI